MRMIATACLLVVWLATPAMADETIRVLLGQDLRKIAVRADRGVLIRDGKASERAVAGSAVITASSTGLAINGVRMRAKTVVIRARGGPDAHLTVVVHQARMRVPSPASKIASMVEPLDTLIIAGVLEVSHRSSGLVLVNDLAMEEYVKGVVPAEMSAAWHPEALKVQAVAARTYALHQKMANTGRDYDVIAGTQDQVYRGRQGVDQRVQDAVEATRGLILTYHDAPILAAFSSTAAGPTEDALYVWAKDLPYLKGVDCPFDMSSPYYQWRVEMPVDSLEDALRKQGIPVGTIASLTPYLHSPSGRVDKIRILHSEGELILRGQDFRRAVGYSRIPSTQFEVEAFGRDAVISGRGSGHGVGLCQWGAKELAEHGYRFDTILHYYFPGTQLTSLRPTSARIVR